VSTTRVPGLVLALLLLVVFGGIALTVNFPRTAVDIQSDEATYYLMGHSLVRDHDLAYRSEDFVRVRKEFPNGPTGVFLKRGHDVVAWGVTLRPPFFWTTTKADADRSRLFFGKSFIYPLFAAPFVALLGTNGFLFFHAVLLALVAWCGYLFLQARMPPLVSALLAGSFILSSVVPVYFVWITPELFNFSLGALAYFCWLYKEVAPDAPERRSWLFRPASDVVAALILGIATFSKPTNVLLFVPMVIWWGWRRRWRELAIASAALGVVAAGLFAANLAISGDWNYQGGERKTFYGPFPFETPTTTFDSIVQPLHGRDEALGDIILNERVFWTNLTHNAAYFFIGRYAGLVAYFFPAVFALALFFAAPRRRPAWQYLVVLAFLAQMLVFIIMTPYTWNGGGGSVGNRYFMSAYGIMLFVFPPVRRALVALVPWIAGGVFVAPMVLHPFAASIRPGDNAKHGALRLLPPELTLVYDWPTNTEGRTRTAVWYGDYPKGSSPGFQIYFFDDNSYLKEEDNTFWVKGGTRAEFLIKTDRPMKRIVLNLTAGAVATNVKASVEGRSLDVSLNPGESKEIQFALPKGFVYQGIWPVWRASVSSSAGFTPTEVDPNSKDTRFLGVRVRPTIVE
jgi:hypothetical protein